MNSTHRLRTIKYLLCALALSVLLFPLSLSGVQKAHAQGIPVSDVLSTIQNTLTALSSASLEQKELVWDGLFYDIANQAIQQMTSDILEWANSGFDGEPAFVTDLLGFMEDIADDVASDFIYGDELGSLCTPFQLDVRIAIAEEYQRAQHGSFKEKAECTIDDIAGGDPEAFFNGEFSAGGWAMWFELALHPENSPIGAKLAGKSELEARIASKQAVEQKKLDWGDGFRSQEVCKNVQKNGTTQEECTTTTPGALIKDQVSLALQAPTLRLIGADEMNEIIGALFSNLANQAISGANGLLGLGGNASFSANVYGDGGNLSYLDAVRQEQTNSGGSTGGNRIEQALRTETQVLELQLAIINELDAISTTYLDAQEPYEDDSCWNLEFPEELSDKLDELVQEVPTTVNTVVKLEGMLTDYESSTSAQAQLQILQQLSSMQSSGELSGRTAVIQYENYLRNELRSQVEDLEEAIGDEEDSC